MQRIKNSDGPLPPRCGVPHGLSDRRCYKEGQSERPQSHPHLRHSSRLQSPALSLDGFESERLKTALAQKRNEEGQTTTHLESAWSLSSFEPPSPSPSQ
jgi:hypothetical protein